MKKKPRSYRKADMWGIVKEMWGRGYWMELSNGVDLEGERVWRCKFRKPLPAGSMDLVEGRSELVVVREAAEVALKGRER